MKLVINNPRMFEKFANIFQHASSFNDALCMNVSSQGIFIQGFDVGRICMLEMRLNAEWFAEFEFDSGTDMGSFGIYPKTLYKILNTDLDLYTSEG